MALGLRDAGFGPTHSYEVDAHACATLRLGSQRSTTFGWTVHEGDIHSVNWAEIVSPVRLLAGGAPCRPFSLGGSHKAHDDGRNLFPQVFRAIRALSPTCVVLENVRGILRASFLPYWEYILAQLQNPSIAPRKNESWRDHYKRIKTYRAGLNADAEYTVTWRLVDAADYGVAQNRLRVILIATRANLPRFPFPEPTHSCHALIRTMADGSYWRRHSLPIPRRLPFPKRVVINASENTLPWVTVRDAVDSLTQPATREEGCTDHHWLIPGARSYKGHRGSKLDWTSKTIKAGVHGVPGGENTLRDGTRFRYYTLREAARIQSFPDWYMFSGARLHVTRQIGNAVPPILARAIAIPLHAFLSQHLSAARPQLVAGQRLAAPPRVLPAPESLPSSALLPAPLEMPFHAQEIFSLNPSNGKTLPA